jgi:uncharacterized membrane protein
MINNHLFRKKINAKNCGPECLRWIAHHHGKKYSIKKLREKSSANHKDTTLQGITVAAESIGYETLAVKINFKKLAEEAILPAIVHWKQNIFIVIRRISNNFVYVYDPLSNKRKYTIKEFVKNWKISSENIEEKGIVLLLEPTSYFHTLKDDRKTIKIRIIENIVFLKKLSKKKKILIISFITIIIISVLLGITKSTIGFINYSILLLLNYLGFYVSFVTKGVLKYNENNIISKICHYSESFDCDRVANERLFKIFKFSDIGLVYFSTVISLIILSLINYNFFNLLAYVSFCTLPGVLILILIQLFKIKKICPLCMFVHLILIIDFILLYKYLIHLSGLLFDTIPVFIFITMILTSTLIITNMLLIEYKKKIELSKIVEFYDNTESLIGGYINNQSVSNFKILPKELIFGNNKSANSILLILTFGCKNCQKILKKILENNSNIKIIIRFRDYNELNIKAIETIYKRYQANKQNTIDVILNWYDFLFAGKIDEWYYIYKINKDDCEINNLIDLINIEIENIQVTPSIYFNNKYIHYYLHNSFLNYLKTIKFDNDKVEIYHI